MELQNQEEFQAMLNKVYDQGWLDAQKALSEWIGEFGNIDQANANFYQEFSKIVASLQLVREDEEDGATPDMSRVSDNDDNQTE